MADNKSYAATNTDFRIQYNALRTQARVYDLDPNEPKLNNLLIHTAEVEAQAKATQRWLYSFIHKE